VKKGTHEAYRLKHSEHLWQELQQVADEHKDHNPHDWVKVSSVMWYTRRVAMSPYDKGAKRRLRILLDGSGLALNFATFSYLERFYDDLTLSEFLAWGKESE